jgi:hypothetical protein
MRSDKSTRPCILNRGHAFVESALPPSKDFAVSWGMAPQAFRIRETLTADLCDGLTASEAQANAVLWRLN